MGAMSHSDFFDSAAATWDDDPGKMARSHVIAAAIARAVPLAGVRDALEYGCGTGQVTWALARHLPSEAHVSLADASPGMLEVVRARLAERPEAERERFGVLALDLTQDRLPADSLDLVYTSMALHHVLDLATVLRRFRQGLRPDGWLAVADLDHDPEGAFHGEHFTGHHGFQRDQLATELRASGFSEPTFETVTTLVKEHEGREAEFPVFLATCRLA